MYASLGNITFQALKGFNHFVDEQEAVYAEHALIETKPRLQRTGSSLQSLELRIKFHIAFCNPEVEYDTLNAHMIAGDILPLTYGTGYYENDFIIKKLTKTVLQTGDDGSYIDINVDISLLEFYDPNKVITRQERDKLSAFAVDVDRPLPVGPPKLDNTLSAQLAKLQQQIRNETVKINSAIKKVQGQINEYLDAPNAIIGMGQQFVNVANSLQSNIYPMTQKITNNLGIMSTLLSGSAALYNINPGLTPSIVSGQSVVSNMQSAIGQFAGLPTTVTNNTQGQASLDIFNNLKTSNDSLQSSSNDLFSNFGAYAVLLALRKLRL